MSGMRTSRQCLREVKELPTVEEEPAGRGD
jgi:hypothetical protein